MSLKYTHGPVSVHCLYCPSASTISNMNICATSGLITMKFYQKHHWDEGKAAFGFGLDWIKTLVSIATDSSQSVIMEKTVLPLFQLFFIRSFLYLQVMMACMRAWRSSKISEIRLLTAELAALERLKKKNHKLIMEKWCCHFFLAVF